MSFEHDVPGGTPYYKAGRLREELALRLGDLDLDVEFAGELVVVSGSVTSDAQREAISSVCVELLPGVRVRNETRVPRTSAPEPEPL